MRSGSAFVLIAGALATSLAACGDAERPRALPVGEAPLPQSLGDEWDAPRAAADTSDRLDLPALSTLDSLAADSLRRDTTALDTFRLGTAPPPAARVPAPPIEVPTASEPAFGPAWAAFQSGDAPPILRTAAVRARSAPFGDAVGALTPRDFRRDGTRRRAVVRVGFDADGHVVPQETAVRDSSVQLTFDLVDGAYRLTDLRFSG